MSSRFFDEIDWRRPWLAPLRAVAMPIIEAADWRAALNAAARAQDLKNHRGLSIRFIPQAELPLGTGYEVHISATACVPTRDNLHDFFNALVWLRFPEIKARLNALQSAEIERASESGDRASRGKVRDGATIFDENAALLVTRDATLITALRDHQWQDVFVAGRDRFSRDCRVFLFGHALIEKLVSPYKAITAHTWIVRADDAFFAMPVVEQWHWLDATVNRQLVNGVKTADFTPLPILGVPAWWHEQGEEFYGDISVFRPKRVRVATSIPRGIDRKDN